MSGFIMLCSLFQVTTPEDGKRCGFGNFPVTVIPHYPLRLSDGVHLSLKFWFPFQATDGTNFENHSSHLAYKPEKPSTAETLPAVIEYLPYRKDDWTFTRDWRHLWMCSHGYVCVRIDFRGTGDSEGLYFDEYAEQEQKDGVEVRIIKHRYSVVLLNTTPHLASQQNSAH